MWDARSSPKDGSQTDKRCSAAMKRLICLIKYEAVIFLKTQCGPSAVGMFINTSIKMLSGQICKHIVSLKGKYSNAS